MQIYNTTASFVRPADTTAYTIGDLIANSTTAGSVVPMTFTLGNAFGVGQFRLTRIRISHTKVDAANNNFRLHLYQAVAPVVANGDNGAWSTDQAANYLGPIDVTSTFAFTDGATGVGAATAGSEFLIRTSNKPVVYGLLEARAAYTPASGETFTVTIEELESY